MVVKDKEQKGFDEEFHRDTAVKAHIVDIKLASFRLPDDKDDE